MPNESKKPDLLNTLVDLAAPPKTAQPQAQSDEIVRLPFTLESLNSDERKDLLRSLQEVQQELEMKNLFTVKNFDEALRAATGVFEESKQICDAHLTRVKQQATLKHSLIWGAIFMFGGGGGVLIWESLKQALFHEVTFSSIAKGILGLSFIAFSSWAVRAGKSLYPLLAIAEGKGERLEYYLRARYPMDGRDIIGDGIFDRVIDNDRPDMLLSLLSHGFEVNSRTQSGNPLLPEAVAQKKLGMIMVLLAAGADPMLTTKEGQDALQLADGIYPEYGRLLREWIAQFSKQSKSA